MKTKNKQFEERLLMGRQVLECAGPPALSVGPGLLRKRQRAAAVQDAAALARLLRAFLRRPEMLVFLALTLWFSAPALTGSFSNSMIFQPEAVHHGEWWRLGAHPFVHVTWYHLLLDGAAFFLLYHSLLETGLVRRLAYVAAGGAGSLLFSWAAAPAIATSGLCGLSGIAHGLMAVSALEMVALHPRRTAEWRYGLFTLLMVVGKAAIEALSGRVLFGFLYFGLVGNPVAVSHAGGILGCLTMMLFFRSLSRPHNLTLLP
jgi:membrane associated rhomboid family serine protease